MRVAFFVESKNIVIDAVYVELDYIHPCDRCTQQDPVCTPEEQAAQLASLDSIKELARSLPVSEIPLPTNLYRVKLCNGDEVYLLQHELDLLQGDYIILQSVTVNNLTQTFTTGFPGTTGTPYTGPPPPRYDLFALKLLYYGNDSQIKGVNKGYGNGNIAAMHWQITGRDRQAYSFLYDNLDRLRHGFYAEITKNDFYYNRGLYDEWSITYDLVGNLETLNRNGAYGGCDENGQFLFQYDQIDDLIYKYDAERTHLTGIADNAGGDAALKGVRSPENGYDYDFNGNLISDSGKGMTAEYNHLNLPREVTVQSINSIDPGGIIQWVYDATGRKLKKKSPDGITLYHSLSRIYFGNGIEKAGGGTFVYHAEGRAAFYPGNPGATPPVEDKWYYEFAMRDHPEVNSGQALGNTRITFADLNYDGYIQANPGDWIADDPHGSPVGYTEVLQENHYYPFGMNMEGPWREPEVEAKVNRYQYNGKELNSDLGLGWNDYGARWYDAAIGRFTGVDPLASKIPGWSPYSYGFNNPIRFIDPDGRSADDVILKYSNNDKGCSCLGTFLNQVNQNFSGQFEARTESVYDADGNVVLGQERLTIVPTGGDLSKLSEGAQNFYSGLSEVINNSNTVEIGLVAGETSVSTGNYKLSQIDVADVGQFPVLDQSKSEQAGPTQAGKILHEVKEQFSKQVYRGIRPGQDGSFGQIDSDHKSAMGFEDSVNGNTRGTDRFSRSGVVERFQLKSGKVNEYYIGTTRGVISVNKTN